MGDECAETMMEEYVRSSNIKKFLAQRGAYCECRI
jgi:hypothetical protein